MTVFICFQWRSQPNIWSRKCKFFCVYRPCKESISKEMNNDNDLNLHSVTKLSGWLRYCMFHLDILLYHVIKMNTMPSSIACTTKCFDTLV